MNPHFISIGSAFAGISVLLGAFGAHTLNTRLTPEMLKTFETGVRYQTYHSLGLILLGILLQLSPNPWVLRAGYCLLAGIFLFSGSLYGLALGGPRFLGPVTPIGGILWIIGWSLAAIGSYKA